MQTNPNRSQLVNSTTLVQSDICSHQSDRLPKTSVCVVVYKTHRSPNRKTLSRKQNLVNTLQPEASFFSRLEFFVLQFSFQNNLLCCFLIYFTFFDKWLFIPFYIFYDFVQGLLLWCSTLSLFLWWQGSLSREQSVLVS